MEGKKILEICNFSAGIAGTWSRVFDEAKRLAKKNDVYVYSSDLENNRPMEKKQETLEGIKIKRFPVKKRKGYALFFDFEKDALALKPDIIVVHGYRKPYTNKAVKIAKKIDAKIYLVTHAPFLEKGIRDWKLEILASIYDKILGKRTLRSFNKIIAITKWEVPYLLALGVKRENIEVIPNGVSEEFFSYKKSRKIEGKILFFGRIDKIKDIETLLIALSKVKTKYSLDLTGPGDINYIKNLKSLAKNLKVNATFNPPIYSVKEKIKKLDSCSIFVLPSKREGMPISLIEALSREKIVISSDTQGGKEIIENGKNGYLFNKGNSSELAEKISFCLDKRNKTRLNRIRIAAKKSAKKYSWNTLIDKIERILDRNA